MIAEKSLECCPLWVVDTTTVWFDLVVVWARSIPSFDLPTPPWEALSGGLGLGVSCLFAHGQGAP